MNKTMNDVIAIASEYDGIQVNGKGDGAGEITGISIRTIQCFLWCDMTKTNEERIAHCISFIKDCVAHSWNKEKGCWNVKATINGLFQSIQDRLNTIKEYDLTGWDIVEDTDVIDKCNAMIKVLVEYQILWKNNK